MPKASISELLAASPLMRPNERDHSLSAARELHVFRDDDSLKGKVHKGARPAHARSGGLGAKLSKLVSERKWSGRRARLRGGKTAFVSDPRQRVVATARGGSSMTATTMKSMRTRVWENGRRRISATSA